MQKEFPAWTTGIHGRVGKTPAEPLSHQRLDVPALEVPGAKAPVAFLVERIRHLRERVGALAARAVRAVAASLLQLEEIPVQLAHRRKIGNTPRGRGRASLVRVSSGSPSTPPPGRNVTRSPQNGGGALPLAATLGGAPRTVNDFVLIDAPSGPGARWVW